MRRDLLCGSVARELARAATRLSCVYHDHMTRRGERFESRRQSFYAVSGPGHVFVVNGSAAALFTAFFLLLAALVVNVLPHFLVLLCFAFTFAFFLLAIVPSTLQFSHDANHCTWESNPVGPVRAV